jgi:2-polyprenyl-6-methoxyphenol hydroxylase-like FAD-dependent oxidoreductase
MAMHYQGFDVSIYEKVHKFQRLGDSLGLGENALRLLQRWGLHDRLIEIADQKMEGWQDIGAAATDGYGGLYRTPRRLS